MSVVFSNAVRSKRSEDRHRMTPMGVLRQDSDSGSGMVAWWQAKRERIEIDWAQIGQFSTASRQATTATLEGDGGALRSVDEQRLF